MDRMYPCGGYDVGSIPAGGALLRKKLYFLIRRLNADGDAFLIRISVISRASERKDRRLHYRALRRRFRVLRPCAHHGPARPAQGARGGIGAIPRKGSAPPLYDATRSREEKKGRGLRTRHFHDALAKVRAVWRLDRQGVGGRYRR